MTNKELRKALLKKLGVTPQALSQRVQKLKENHPITTTDATYIIAQREGIILDRYLDKDTIGHVRGLLQQISPATQARVSTGRKTREEREVSRTIVFPKEFKVTDPILPQKKILEAKEMTAVYPLLYIMENSIRELIDTIMTSRHGKDWWDSEAPKGLRKTVADRTLDEKKHSWHQRRGDRPLDYLDLDQLKALMRKIEKEVVPDIIPSIEWFMQLVDEVYKSRCVVCHMNPLDKDNIQAVKLRLRQWQKQIRAKRNLILDKSLQS